MTVGYHEPIVADEWIYATLQAASGLSGLGSGDAFRAYPDVAPAGTDTPYIIYSFVGGSDEHALGPDHQWSNLRYIVKLVTKGGSFAAHKELVKAIDQALIGVGGTALDGNVYGCVAVSPFRYTELSGGELFRHQGRTYALVAQSL